MHYSGPCSSAKEYLSALKDNFSATGTWDILLWDTSGLTYAACETDEYSLYVKDIGRNGLYEVYMGFQTVAGITTDTAHVRCQVMTSFDIDKDFTQQPGTSWADAPNYLNLYSSAAMTYNTFLNRNRAVLFVETPGRYSGMECPFEFAYLGLIETYNRPSVDPYPTGILASSQAVAGITQDYALQCISAVTPTRPMWIYTPTLLWDAQYTAAGNAENIIDKIPMSYAGMSYYYTIPVVMTPTQDPAVGNNQYPVRGELNGVYHINGIDLTPADVIYMGASPVYLFPLSAYRTSDRWLGIRDIE